MDKQSSFIINNSIKNPNENVLSGLKLLIVLIISFIALLPIFLLYMPKKSTSSVVSTTLITLFSLFLFAIFAFALFRMTKSSNTTGPGSNALKSVLSGNVVMLILYTIGLIFFFVLVPSTIMNKYAYLFLPITILISIVLFSLNIAENHNPLFYNSEKVKFSIISVCFIITMILFYNKNPGGYIQKYLGGTLLLTILLAVFGLLYLMTLFFGKGQGQGQGQESKGFFSDLKSKNSSNLDIVSTIGFILFVLLITVGIAIYPGGLLKQNTSTSATILTCVLLITIGLVMYFSKGLLGTTANVQGDGIKTVNDIFRSALLLIFGLGFSGVMIAWLVNSLGNLSSTSGIVSFVLNLLIVVAILSLAFKLITGTPVYKIPGVRLLVNILFYIPCIFVNLIDGGVWLFGKAKGVSLGKTDPTTTTHWILLALIILLFFLYLSLPYIQKQVLKQGGTLLLNNPVSLTTQNTLGAYQTLNGSTNYDYQYAISFWFTLDAVGPNTSVASNKFTSIMSYGGKPNVLYNASTNTLMITMKTKDPNQELISKKHDENGELIVYERTGVLLQKWTHLIVNYNGGNLDIFYDGELVKTIPGVVPYMEYDNLNIGYEDGVHGEICNLNYFKKNLTIQQVYYLYHLVKDKNPPVSYDSKDTIIELSDSNAKDIYGGAEISMKKVQQEVAAIVTGDSIPNTLANTMNPFKKQDFLSLRWYFSANNDNVGSMT